MARMRRLRAGLSRIDGAPRYRDLGVDVFLGEGRFTGHDTADGRRPDAPVPPRRHRDRRPARGAAHPGPGDDGLPHQRDDLRPDRAAAGGSRSSARGRSAASWPRRSPRLGSAVTVIDEGAHILPREDADVAQIVGARHGIARRAAAARPPPWSAPRRGAASGWSTSRSRDAPRRSPATSCSWPPVARRTSRTWDSRRPAWRTPARGVGVNDRLRTSNPRIFAVGDICSKYQFTHAADATARLVVANALFFGLGGGKVSSLVMPWVTYTTPEVAHVGMTEADAMAAGIRVQTITVPLHDVDRAVLDGQEDGFLRVHLKAGTDRILGATLVAEHAGEMIGEIALAITAGVGLGKIGSTIHPYPTQAEVFRKAADAWRRTKLTPSAKRAFRAFFRLIG